MKKIFACVLALLMLVSFCACESNEEPQGTTIKPVELDEELLRSDWKDGIIYFENGGTVDLPCTMDEIVETSGLKITDIEGAKRKVLQPGETVNFNLAGEGVQMRLTFKNKTEEPLTADQATIVGYSYTNVNKNNVGIKFAKTLTVNVRRTDIEEALGLPDGATSEDVSYTYVGRDSEKKRVELRVNFNTSDLVNSVYFYVGS